MPAPEVEVEIELVNSAGSHLLTRRLFKAGKRAVGGELQLCLPNGATIDGSQAEQRLAQMARSEFRDFLTTVYQHQEAIRAVLTQEPKERNDAIDRLLGLSDFRNLLDAVDGVKAAERHRCLRQSLKQFESNVQVALTGREHDLDELRREMTRAGIPQAEQNSATATTKALAVKAAVVELARQVGSAPPSVPDVSQDAKGFVSATKDAITRLRSEMPAVKEQQEVFQRQQALLQFKTKLERARGEQDSLRRSIADVEREYGDQEALLSQLRAADDAIAEQQNCLRQANRYAALLREAIDFLENQAKPEPSSTCPLCNHESPGLLAKLRSQCEEELQRGGKVLLDRIEQVKRQREQLAKVQKTCQAQRQQLDQAMVEWTQQRQAVGEFLRRNLLADDDAVALVSAELQAVEERQRQLQAIVEAKQLHLNAVERDLEAVRLLSELLSKEEKLKLLEKIEENPGYRQLGDVRDQIAQWVSDLEAVYSAIAASAREEAEEKLKKAEEHIDSYFRSLARHPAISRIRLSVTESRQRNQYSITGENGDDLTPILSQGDLNALALAIFLGLASAGADQAPFGFIMLDDPSQSLATEHKRQLVKILDGIAGRKQVIVATMDKEFRDLLISGLTKEKQEYVFGAWSPQAGPSIRSR
jgi:DNA repair exonuclease SbcCD ATPase subunit